MLSTALQSGEHAGMVCQNYLWDCSYRWSAFVFLWLKLYSNSDIRAVIDIYFQMTDIFVAWMPALIGLLIKWSISGFLQPTRIHTERLSFGNISLQLKFSPMLWTKQRCSKIMNW
ncbi:hypothetical protein Y032_0032g2463 [Ancylostoma ceylanicum]|nr:hypothetical protein Y032_0032g2463 [Ancylostoma ceylanicum]